MDPLTLNTLIAAITNHLYSELSQREFDYLTVVLTELSKSMVSIAVLRKICEWDKKKK